MNTEIKVLRDAGFEVDDDMPGLIVYEASHGKVDITAYQGEYIVSIRDENNDEYEWHSFLSFDAMIKFCKEKNHEL